MLDTNWNDDFEQQARGMQPLQPLGAGPADPFAGPAKSDEDAWSSGSSGRTSSPGPTATSPQAQNVINTLGVAPVTAPAQSRWTPDYGSSVAAVYGAPDQPSAAAAHDQLARDVTRHLALEGHDVQPGENGQLLVDGRAYTIAGSDSVHGWGTTDTFGDDPTGEGNPPPVGTTPSPTTPAPTTPAATTPAATPPAGPAGAPTPPFGSQYHWQQTPEGQDLFNRMKQAFPDMSDAEIAQHLNYPDMPDKQFFDAITANIANARRAAQQTTSSTSTTATTGGPQNGDYKSWFMSLVAGKPVSQDSLLSLEAELKKYGVIITPPNTQGERNSIGIPDGAGGYDWYRVGYGEGQWVWTFQGKGGPDTGTGGNDQHWQPTSSATSTYTPSAIPTTDPRLETLGNWLANDPQSMSDKVVAQLETRDAEDRQLAHQSQDEAIKRYGYQAGLEDSPWLASERAANTRAADEGIIGGRRNIEIEAARTNTADLRSAISSLSQIAASTRDRFALNEQLKLEAAKLGMSADQFMQQLLMRMYELQLQDSQFGSRLAFDYDQLNEQSNEAFWNATTR